MVEKHQALLLLEAAMKVESKAEADNCLAAMVGLLSQTMTDVGHDYLETIARRNVGYFAGYYSHETRLRVEDLFGTEHPYLGSAKNGQLSPREIFELGRKLGEEWKNRSEGCVNEP